MRDNGRMSAYVENEIIISPIFAEKGDGALQFSGNGISRFRTVQEAEVGLKRAYLIAGGR